MPQLKGKTVSLGQFKTNFPKITAQEIKSLQSYMDEQADEDYAVSSDGIDGDQLLDMIAMMSSPGKPSTPEHS